MQEVVCAKTIVVTCGNATCQWDDLVPVIHVIDATRHASSHAIQNPGSKTTTQYVQFMEELRYVTEQGTKQAVKDYANEESMVPYVLTMAKDCEATNHRDKLFAFHHIVRLWNRPDYATSIEMLYQFFATQYLQRIAYAISVFSCDEMILSRRQMGFLYSAGTCNEQLELPSWVLDWSIPWGTRPLWLGTQCYSAGGCDVKDISPITEIDSMGNTRLRLPLTVKLPDRVLAVGSEALCISRDGTHAFSQAVRDWLFHSISILHRHRNQPSPYPEYGNCLYYHHLPRAGTNAVDRRCHQEI